MLIYESYEQSSSSPCPDIFNYQESTSGIINFSADPFVSDHSITVKMSVAARLQSYIGDVGVGSANEACNYMLNTGRLRYTVNFPVSLPLITGIIYNGKTICSGPGANALFVTSVSVSHKLKCLQGHTIVNRQPPQNNINNLQVPNVQWQSQPQFVRPVQNANQNFDYDYDNEPNMFQPNQFLNNPVLQATRSTTTTTTTTTPLPITQRSQNGRLVPLKECGASELAIPLIVNGRRSEPGRYPWLAAIYYQTRKRVICGGSLINDRYVLTAAHCITESSRDPREYIIYLGVFNIQELDGPGVQKAVGQKLEVHIDYEKRQKESRADADIALIRFSRIRYTSNVRPICLQSTPEPMSNFVGTVATIAGWGANENGSVIAPEVRETTVVIVREDSCRESHIEFRTHLTDRTFCAGGQQRGPCTGDSGGGLYIARAGAWYLRGVISMSLADSFSSSGCDVTNYAIYVDIGNFLDWIMDIAF